MKELLIYAQAYIRLNIQRVIPILVIGLLLEGIFWLLMKKGYTRYDDKRCKSLICGLLLSLEVGFIFVMTLYGRSPGGERKVGFLPFESYVKAFGQGNVEIQLQIIMNVLMFVLLGAMLPLCFKHFEKNKEVVLTAFMISILIETTQGVMHIGMFEVDDMLGNVLGAEIGFGAYYFATWLKKRRKK